MLSAKKGKKNYTHEHTFGLVLILDESTIFFSVEFLKIDFTWLPGAAYHPLASQPNNNEGLLMDSVTRNMTEILA